MDIRKPLEQAEELQRLRNINAELLAALEQVQKDIGDRLTGKTVLMIRAAIAKAHPAPRN